MDSPGRDIKMNANLNNAGRVLANRGEAPPDYTRHNRGDDVEMESFDAIDGLGEIADEDDRAGAARAAPPGAQPHSSNPALGEPGFFNMNFFRPAQKPLLQRKGVLVTVIGIMIMLIIGAALLGHFVNPHVVMSFTTTQSQLCRQ
jgi:hypothetical protein